MFEVTLTWKQRVATLEERLGRKATLEELLTESAKHTLTDEEYSAQKRSWSMQDFD